MTPEDTAESLFSSLQVGTVKLPKLDETTKKDAAESLNALYAKLPQAKGAVKSITINPRLKKSIAQCHEDGSVELSGYWFNDLDKLKAEYDLGVEIKFYPAGGDYRHFFMHEYFHATARKAARKLGKTYDEFCEELRGDTLAKLGIGNGKASITDNLSKYATKNAREFVSEAAAECFNSASPRPIAKEIGRRLVSILGGSI